MVNVFKLDKKSIFIGILDFDLTTLFQLKFIENFIYITVKHIYIFLFQ